MTLDRSRNNDSIPCKIEGCNEPANHSGDIREIGVNKGNGTTLANNVLKAKYQGIANTAKDHALSTKVTVGDKSKRWRMELEDVKAGRSKAERLRTNPNNLSPTALAEAIKKCKTDFIKQFSRTAAAHHLICSESMNNDEWKDICETFGYDINHWKNGVFLPTSFYIPCDLAIPAHRGGHGMESPELENKTYVGIVNDMIKPIKDDALNNDYCKEDGSEELIEELNKISEDIWELILDFKLMLTSDGLNYHPTGPGCQNEDWKPLQEVSTVNCRTNLWRNFWGHGYHYLQGLGGELYFLEREYYANTDEELEFGGFMGGSPGGGGASGGW